MHAVARSSSFSFYLPRLARFVSPFTSGTDIANFSLTARRAIATHPTIKETTMAWTKPEFTDWRFGFEITMYIANR